MNEKTLIMSFEADNGKKFSLSIKDINQEASKSEVVTGIMDHILTSNVFNNNGSTLTKKLAASVVTKETTNISIA